MRFVNDLPQTFSGTVAAGLNTATSANVTIPQNTLLASAQIAWGPLLTSNDLGLAVLDPAGTQRAAANNLNLPGLTGRRERVTLNAPAAGSWQAKVNNTLGLALTAQSFNGVLEVTRVEYAPLDDLAALGANDRAAVLQALRIFVMTPLGNSFRPGFGVTRGALAAAVVQGARVPQYLAAQPQFADVRDLNTRNFVESAQTNGALFPDAQGNTFRPNAFVDRLTTAIVLVRAAGLQGEAEAQMTSSLPITDAASIPAQWRGYVSVALSRSLLTTSNNAFRPQATLTRLELAQALLTLQA